MKKVAVIGSNSFSGSDFIDLLLSERDYEIIGISRSPEKDELFMPYKKNPGRKRFAFYQIDMNKDMNKLQELLSREKPGYIVNFAAQSEVAPSWENPDQWFQTNAVSIAALGNYLRNQDWLERYLHISSPEVYGTCEGIVKENAAYNPSTPYAASKAAGDMMLFTLVKNFEFPMVMMRATNVYGACQQLFKIIPRTVIYLKNDKKILLHGGGAAVKSYIHIRDVSRGELAALEQGTNGLIYHLSPDEGIAVKHVVQKICNLMDKSFEENTETVSERIGQDKAYIIDSGRARKQFGWKTEISFEKGIKGVVQWVEDYWPLIQKQDLEYMHKE
ncbi:MAG: NAD-dependent epimerase/dehydratase family protein [Desulfobacterales bacterium]|nr:NAD-dependent epimerase/dehydratase family protein [Desulfobacterales bacterium]